MTKQNKVREIVADETRTGAVNWSITQEYVDLEGDVFNSTFAEKMAATDIAELMLLIRDWGTKKYKQGRRDMDLEINAIFTQAGGIR